MEYGLIGAKLGHSYSKIIHEAVCGYSYELHPLPTEEEAHAFMQAKEFKAIKNMVIREAEELRLGAFTFEDTTMKDEVDEDQEAVYNIWNSRRQMS